MATTNIFVYNACDRESQLLVSLVRFCDQSDGKFSFLPVESAESVDRMQKFLLRNGLRPEAVQLPFVIMVQPHGRTVMHGNPMHHWLNGLVSALVDSGATAPGAVFEHVVANNLAPYTVRLIAYALTQAAEREPPPPPPAVAAPAAPPAPAPTRITEPEEEEEEGMFTEVSSTTVTTAVPKKKKDNVVNISDIMAQSKQRETMSNNNNRRPF